MDQPIPSQPTITPQQITPSQPRKSILPIILITVGSIEVILPAFFLFVTVPHIIEIFTDKQILLNPFAILGSDIFIISVILLQIIFGLQLLNKQKQLALDSRDKKIAIFLLVCGVFASLFGSGFSIMALVSPTYDLLSTIK